MADEHFVHKTQINPAHTLGSRPHVSAEQWLQTQKRLLQELGEDAYFRLLLEVTRETFGPLVK